MCHSACVKQMVSSAAFLSLSAGTVLRMAAMAELSAKPVQRRIVLHQLLMHLLELAIEPPEGRALLLLLFVLYALLQASKQAAHGVDIIADDRVRRYLVHLKYWTLNLRPLMICPKVLSPPNFIIKVFLSEHKANHPCTYGMKGWDASTMQASSAPSTR